MSGNYRILDSLKLSVGPMYTLDILMYEGGKDAETVACREACTVEMRV